MRAIMAGAGIGHRAAFGDGRTMFIAGNHDVKFVCYPVSERARSRGRALINWVAEVRRDQPRTVIDVDWTRVGTRDFLEHFRDFSMPDIDLIALVEATEVVLEYPMVDRDPLPYWTEGRVTLLGDAAHPMYPIGANGASQAILDAVALEQALAGASSIEAALAGYEERRRETTTEVVLANRENGPEQVLDIADARLTGPDDRVEDLITQKRWRRWRAGTGPSPGSRRSPNNDPRSGRPGVPIGCGAGQLVPGRGRGPTHRRRCRMPKPFDQLPTALSGLGRSMADVEAIVLTHAHGDHLGSSARIKHESGAEVHVHQDDADLARGEAERTNERNFVRDLTRPYAWRSAAFFIRGGSLKAPPVAELSTVSSSANGGCSSPAMRSSRSTSGPGRGARG